MTVQCEFEGPLVVGDATAIITIRSGSGGSIGGIEIFAGGCDCLYENSYSDSYCDVTLGGALPGASITDTSYTISDMPANSVLIIDASQRRITLTDNAGRVQSSDVEVLEWAGLFEWIEAARGGCQLIYVDDSGATLNADTTIEIAYVEREV